MKVADTGLHPKGCHPSSLTTWIQETYTNSHYRANRWTMMEEKPY
ncbi:hypothetical protein [Wolbachia endosymbiont (group A) of Alloplasta piceator]